MAIDPVDFIPDGEEDLADWLSDTPIEESEKSAPEVDKSFPNSIIVANVPKVPAEKLQKLENLLTKLLGKYGVHDRYMPINPKTKTTDGFCIATYENAERIDEAIKGLHSMQLDKIHIFKAYKMDEFDKIVNYNKPEPSKESVEVAQTDVQDLRDWLLDEQFKENPREQFVIRYDAGENEIFWHNPVTNVPDLEYGGEREKKSGKVWCDNKVQWSPRGSYLATFHRPGIALWGGEKFTKRARFQHDDVKFIDFSPNEEFLLTWNGKHAAEQDPESVKVWRISGELVTKFPTPTFSPRGGEFPHFLWSPDGRFLARCSDVAIFVYDGHDEFNPCVDPATEKKLPIKFPDGLATFEWSPKENVLSAWIPEKNNAPARLQLIRMPSRQELAAKNLFSVRDATLHWHPEGRYLCVNAMRMSRTKKTGHTYLEIFRVMEKNVPVETVEIKESVKSFHWETNGHRFCILTTDENGHQLKATFFDVNKECQQVASYELQGSGISHVQWAPAGQYFCMAAIPGGDLVFGQLDANNKLDILHKDEHFLLTEILWDPSSRYLISAVTQAMTSGIRYQTEAGYKMWSFQGRLLYDHKKEKLFQIFWRPHPPALLSEKQQTDVKANLKTYSKRYDALDEQHKDQAKVQQMRERQEALKKWNTLLERLETYRKSKWSATGWEQAWEELEKQGEWMMVTETIEEEIECVELEITD